MHVLAAFLDPGDNGFDLVDLSVALGVLLAASGLVAYYWKGRQAVRQTVRSRLRAFVVEIVDERFAYWTHSIQPEANGGTSLPDAASAARNAEAISRALAEKAGIDVDKVLADLDAPRR